MSNMNLNQELNSIEIDEPEKMLGKGILMPFNASNSGSRKIMFGTHLEQRLALSHPDAPYVSTGYEKPLGKFSSSYIEADRDYEVVAKIPKFSFDKKNRNYYLILYSHEDQYLDVIERQDYYHISEAYGYPFNNEFLDSTMEGYTIPKGTPIVKSNAFDEYNNRMDGKNLLAIYGASEITMEDGIVISQSAADKLTSPLFKKVKVVINDNDIPLNLYGDETTYKIFPDIGEETRNGLLCGLRREKKDEMLFLQSYSRLRELLISDEKYIVNGQVIDVDISANNPALLEEPKYQQLKMYNDEKIRMCQAIVNAVDCYLESDGSVRMSYNLEELYVTSSNVIAGKQYIVGDKVFSNIILNVVLLEEIPMKVGDKITNRYGGKGVVTEIKPDKEMPRTQNGRTVDIILNMCGVYGRENPGQLFEVTINHVATYLLDLIESCGDYDDIGVCIDFLLRFFKIVAPSQYEYYATTFANLSDDDAMTLLSSFTDYDCIYTAIKPMSENMTLEKVNQLYKEFPQTIPGKLYMPIKDSKGNLRYVPSRRNVTDGYIYIYRLKQYAEEKFSVTSLSSTNVRNQNARNKLANVYKAPFSRTPIRFGEMETGDLLHLGEDIVVQILMIYSSSPHGRRLAKSLMTDDPFNVDIKLDGEAVNRNGEILAAYLKTKGLRLVFEKIPKKKVYPVLIEPIRFFGPSKLFNKEEKYPIFIPETPEPFDEDSIRKRVRAEKVIEKDPMEVYPIAFFGPSNINYTEEEDTK